MRGNSSTPTTKLITVNAPTTTAPVASFTPTQATGSDPLTVNFTDTSTGDIKSWVWDFGDGSSTTTVTTAKTTVPHIYTYGTNGTYTARLTVTSSTNIQKTATGNITVNAAQPQADFSATPTSTPLQIQFSDSSKGTVNRWSWQFGDGGTSTARNPAYTYKAAGTYPVTLTATGPTGMTNTTPPKSITVSAASTGGLVAAYNFEEASGGTVVDASGQGNHGTLSEAATQVSKRQVFGNALSFDGVNDWVTINDSASRIDQRHDAGGLGVSDVHERLAHRVGQGKARWPRSMRCMPTPTTNKPVGEHRFRRRQVSSRGGSTLTANTWAHLAITYDGATNGSTSMALRSPAGRKRAA